VGVPVRMAGAVKLLHFIGAHDEGPST
jgi:hypothetical protein